MMFISSLIDENSISGQLKGIMIVFSLTFVYIYRDTFRGERKRGIWKARLGDLEHVSSLILNV